MSAGSVEFAAAAASGEAGDEEAGVKPSRQQQQLDSDIKEEILAHLRLVSGTGAVARGAGLECWQMLACSAAG
jgi:hypothetical protein